MTGCPYNCITSTPVDTLIVVVVAVVLALGRSGLVLDQPPTRLNGQVSRGPLLRQAGRPPPGGPLMHNLSLLPCGPR